MDTQFLTSFCAPRSRTDHISRPRLIDRLRRAAEERLVIVAAPAAYGKTTLLAQFAAECDRPVFWYTAEPGDADAGAFIQRVETSLGKGYASGSVAAQDADSTPEAVNTRIVRLVNWLEERPGGAVLLWDDFHHVGNDPQLLAAVDALVTHLPQKCALVIGSRNPPPLPCLDRLLAYRQAALLTSQDLCLTEDETRDALQALRGAEVAQEEARRIREKTQGWMGGVLALESNPGQEAVALSNAGAPLHYFAESVLAGFHKSQRTFLKMTSVLPNLRPDLCNEFMGTSHSEAILQEAYRRTGFLLRIGTPSAVYKWHDLIREALESQFRLESPVLYQNTAKKASSFLARQGEIDHALDLLLKADAHDEMAALLLGQGDSFIRAGKWKALESWLAKLPSWVQDERPELLVLRGRLATRMGEKERAIGYFNRAVELAAGKNDARVRARVLVARSAALRLLGYEPEAEADATAAVKVLENLPGAETELMHALRQRALIHLFRGRYAQAEKYLAEAALLLPKVPDEYESAQLCAALGWAYVELGKVGGAQANLEKAIQLWRRLGNKGELAVSLNNLALLWYRHGELEAARRMLEEANVCATESGFARVEAVVAVSIADLERDRGNPGEAIDWYERGLNLASRVSEANLISYATALMGDTYRLRGELNRAELLLQQAKKLAESQHQLYESALASMYLSLLEASRNSIEVATSHLGDAESLLRESENAHASALLTLYKAEVAFLAKDLKKTRASLEDLWRKCDTLGYSGFLRAEAQRSPALFTWAATCDICDGFFRMFSTETPDGRTITPPALARGRFAVDLKAYALGTSRVYVGDKMVPSDVWQSQKAKELFFYLLANERPVNREKLLADLWPDLDADAAGNNFHISLFRVRNAVHPTTVLSGDAGYFINPDLSIWFDLNEFFERVRKAGELPKGTRQRADALEEALKLCNGAVLDDFYSEWTETIRKKVDTAHVGALSSLAGFYTGQKDFGRALHFLEQAARYDELEEEVTVEIMRCHIAGGDAMSAIKVYEDYLGEDTFDREPSPALQGLLQEARRKAKS
ncbi:MAG: tetratricopeptide repeat protein [Chloroflexi bacterium]|nr:tetratricopeptide repeat protein [Chloroflexota bacterium]